MRLISWVKLSKAAAIALFLMPSITVAGRNKKKESTSMSSDDEFFDVYEIETFVIDVICGTLEEVVEHGFENALLKFYEDEVTECGSERNVTSVQLVKFEPALDCDKNRLLADGVVGGDRELRRKRNKSKAKVNKRSRSNRNCRRCDDRLLKEKGDGENFGDAGVRDEESFIFDINVADRELGKKKKHKKKKKKQVSRQTCSHADLVGVLNQYGFNDVTSAEIKKTREVNCSPSSKECNSMSESSGACCGVEGCACPTVSPSLCEAEGCCIEEASNFDPCACHDLGECSPNPYPCGREYDGCSLEPTIFPSLSPSM